MRMAHVWHQIFVHSSNGGAFETYAHAEFQQRLRDGALGTFENLLQKYALSPQLGHFQNWVKNVPEHDGIRPNENFARELLQLFTIGVNQLNDDGTPKLDAKGQLVAAYAQSDIETLARVLTGYTFPTRPGATADFWGNRNYYFGDMIPFDKFHDTGAKAALGGRISFGPGGSAATEVRAAIKALVDHPNTPPFIVEAADPEDGDEFAHAGVRRARRRRVQGQRQGRARRPGGRDARHAARPARRAARARSTASTGACASPRCSGRR